MQKLNRLDHAKMAENAAKHMERYAQVSRSDIAELAGDCAKTVNRVFDTKPKALIYFLQGDKRRSIVNLWLYKRGNEIDARSVFNHVVSSRTRDLLKDALQEASPPAGYAGACQKMRGASEADFDLLHDVLLYDNALARQINRDGFDRNALEFIKCQRPFRMSYSVAKILVRASKEKDFARLITVCSEAEIAQLEKITKIQMRSFEEFCHRLSLWRERLQFPAEVPGEPILHERDGFQLIRSEAELRRMGRKFKNCLRHSYRAVYSEESHRGHTRIFLWRGILLRISLGTSCKWNLSELDEGCEHLDTVNELKDLLQNRGVAIEPIESTASAARRVCDTNDWDFDL